MRAVRRAVLADEQVCQLLRRVRVLRAVVTLEPEILERRAEERLRLLLVAPLERARHARGRRDVPAHHLEHAPDAALPRPRLDRYPAAGPGHARHLVGHLLLVWREHE